jgi:acyl carrier protein
LSEVTVKQVAEIMAMVLSLDTVGTDDDFFELGGHSLLALRLIGEIEDRLNVPLSASDLFAGPTPALIARQLNLARSVNETPSGSPQ